MWFLIIFSGGILLGSTWPLLLASRSWVTEPTPTTPSFLVNLHTHIHDRQFSKIVKCMQEVHFSKTKLSGSVLGISEYVQVRPWWMLWVSGSRTTKPLAGRLALDYNLINCWIISFIVLFTVMSPGEADRQQGLQLLRGSLLGRGARCQGRCLGAPRSGDTVCSCWWHV